LILKGITVVAVSLGIVLSTLPVSAMTESQAFILVSEEYTDNILLDQQRIEEYITRVVPTVTLHHENRMFKIDGKYSLDYKYYANYARNDYRSRLGLGKDDIDHVVDVTLEGEPVRNTLFINAQETYKKVSLDVARDYSEESYFLNQIESNMFDINPYLVLRPFTIFDIKTGYVYRKMDYVKVNANDSVDQAVYVELERRPSDNVAYGAGYRYHTQDNQINDLREYEEYVTMRYGSEEANHISIRLGNSHFRFENGAKTNSFTWDVTGVLGSERYGFLLESKRNAISNPKGAPLKEDTYRIVMTSKMVKSSHSYSASYSEFSDLATGENTTKRYRAFGAIKYDVTSTTGLNVDARYDVYRDEVAKTQTDVYYISAAVRRTITKRIGVSLAYRYTESSSEDVPGDNYHNNRFILTLGGQVW